MLGRVESSRLPAQYDSMCSDNWKKEHGRGRARRETIGFINGRPLSEMKADAILMSFVSRLVCIMEKQNVLEIRNLAASCEARNHGLKETFQTKSIHVTFHRGRWETICLTQRRPETPIIVYRAEQINGMGAEERVTGISRRHLLPPPLRDSGASERWRIKVVRMFSQDSTVMWNNTFICVLPARWLVHSCGAHSSAGV